MSGNVQPTTPPPYNTWLTDTLAELGARQRQVQVATPTIQMAQGQRPLLAPAPTGKGTSWMPGSGIIRSLVFGSQGERATISKESKDKIDDLTSNGMAAPVDVVANGRTLKGNFFTAEGHNLKDNGGQPDTSRPLVLLLTGSGGSAEDQGLDTSEFYAKSGASVLSVNYGGYGESDPTTPTEESVLQDAHAMLQHAIDMGYDPANIVIHGYSLGGAVAGKLKESVETGGVKLRGLVLDRPMLSAAHGAESHVSKGIKTLAGQITRKTLGKLSARSAITGSANTDTRIVVTSDEGYFADKADEFRQQLQTSGQSVTGNRSNKGHFDHKDSLQANQNELKELIGKDRTGSAQNISSGKGANASRVLSELLDEANTTLNYIRDGLQEFGNKVGRLEQGTPSASSIKVQMNTIDQELTKCLDFVRYSPDTNMKKKAENYSKTLIGLEERLQVLLDNAGDTSNTPPGLADQIAGRAAKALDVLQKAGGPSANNKAQEDEVLAADDAVRKLRGATLDQTLLLDLTTTQSAILQRRKDSVKRGKSRRGAVIGLKKPTNTND